MTETHPTYAAAIAAAAIGATTEDGNGYGLAKLGPNRWAFTEPSDDAPGHADYVLDDAQAADVLENVFPGSFDSPNA